MWKWVISRNILYGLYLNNLFFKGYTKMIDIAKLSKEIYYSDKYCDDEFEYR